MRPTREERQAQRKAQIQRLIAEYERSGEPDGCYFCGDQNHHTSDCHTNTGTDAA